jgi:hypothetical protein
MSKPKTLADFSVPIPLNCFYCESRLPSRSTVEIHDLYVIVCCPKCGLLTPFKIEKAA